MKIQDASDRVYQGQVCALLDQARSSIVVSMFLIRPGDHPKHPVNRLLERLLEARRRGVEVTIYLNTKLKSSTPQKISEGPWFDRLREAGVRIHLVSPVRMLHDKLVVVDRRIVVEGSMNWSVAAIASNLESATVIESPALAESKLRRFGFFPIWGKEEKKVPEKPKPLFPAGPPTSIEVPAALLEEQRYFPDMIAFQRERALKLFLFFLFFAQAQGAAKFGIVMESAGEYLGILRGKDRASVRRQIIRVLRDLETIDHLLHAEFRHGKEAWIEIFPPPGGTFTLSSEDLGAGELAELTDNEIFFRLIRARLRPEGKRLEDLTQDEIMRRFFIDHRTIRRTLGPRRRARKSGTAPL